MKESRTILAVIMLIGCVGLGGCFSSHAVDIQAFTKPHQTDITADNYILQPPDEITIHCSRAPELHLQRQIIRPDGRVAFENIGELLVAGKTPAQVAQLLLAKVMALYNLPNDEAIEVRVVANKSKTYYVLGEVTRPGPKVYTGRDSVLTAVSKANPLVTGWTNRIQVIRPSADKSVKPKIFEVNWKRMVVRGDTSRNVLLQEGDIVYVPPTILAAIAMKIEEFVRPISRAMAPAISIQRVAP